MNKLSYLLTLVIIGLLQMVNPFCFAAEQVGTYSGEAIVYAPEGLSNTEQSSLERQYRYSFRDKGRVLSPFTSTGGTVIPEGITAQRVKEEKLYRYFGAAASLYRKGKLEEAIQILKYVSEEKPDDDYVKQYLNRLVTEKDIQRKKWGATSESDARILKSERIKNLIKEGVDYYKQKSLDTAFLKFYNAQTLDPDNNVAKKYIDELKQYYLREIQVAGMVEDYEKKSAMNGMHDEDAAVNKLLDEQEAVTDVKNDDLSDEKEILSSAKSLLDSQEDQIQRAAQKILDEEQIKSIIMEKKSTKILKQAELELMTRNIIEREKAEEKRSNEYTFGAGDVVQISVRDHPELSGKALVRLDGEIILPLVNDVVLVQDLTLQEATVKIKDTLKRYIKDPFAALTIEEYRSKTFYVMDEVGCTPYPITRANLTLRDALFTADWGANRALGRVLVMKPDRLHPIVRKVDAFDIMYRGKLVDNIRIEDGDVIYAPLTVAAKVSQTIVDALRPFAAVRQARNEWINYKADERSYKDLPRIHYNKDTTTAWDASSFPTSLVTVQ